MVKYFVPSPKPETSRGGTKYFVRLFPLASELSEVWTGSGPDLPVGYEGAEACPDCSAFRFSKHETLCIRNPLSPWELSTAWKPLHTKSQIFFGAGHPITPVDDYMSVEKQKRLQSLGVVVMYGDSGNITDANIENRAVIASWRERGRK
ncbi:MAG: hypothetical protein ACR2H1_11395 [Limisphaerales bacterium]